MPEIPQRFLMRLCASAAALLTIHCGALLGQGSEPSFEADWDSLQAYECPDWFRDAKFGIYSHWGPYSATFGPGGTDWYSRNMYIEGSKTHDFHLEKYGPLDEFGYKDFIPLFKAEKFNADEWADLYVEAGARFAGPVAEHAGGFAMWDSEVTKWNAADMGPKRDIVGEMEKASRKHGLKFVATFHHHYKWGWYPTLDTSTDTSDPAFSDLYGPPLSPKAFGTGEGHGGLNPNRTPEIKPDHAFSQEWLDKVVEVVDAYRPDLIWFDTRMRLIPEAYRKKMAAHYYNAAQSWGKEVVLTYKESDMIMGTATVDLERSRMPQISPDPWLTDTSVASNTWGFSNDIEYYSTERLVHDLVDIVSKNGSMLLNIAPHPDGTIPEEQKEILRGIGRWLKLNGEAIYASRPWFDFGEGPTKTPVGHLSDRGFDGFAGQDIRFTTNSGYLYAISFGWPEKGEPIKIKRLGNNALNERIASIELVGSEQSIRYERTNEELQIFVPEKKPCEYAYVFKIAIAD